MKSTTINVEAVPNSPNETQYLDLSEKEYNRMISQQMMYHKVMMEDLMKLATETETGAGAGAGSNSSLQMQDQMQRQMSMVAGLGNTVEKMNTSNQQLLELANKKTKQGGLNAQTASTLSAKLDAINANLHNDVVAYDKLTQEGFSNPNPNPNPNPNHNMKAALDNSAIVLESQKYALALFGAVSIYVLYKTVKYL
jgi:hypothetical protein